MKNLKKNNRYISKNSFFPKKKKINEMVGRVKKVSLPFHAVRKRNWF